MAIRPERTGYGVALARAASHRRVSALAGDLLVFTRPPFWILVARETRGEGMSIAGSHSCAGPTRLAVQEAPRSQWSE